MSARQSAHCQMGVGHRQQHRDRQQDVEAATRIRRSRAAFALAASSAATRPSTFFWFGQMMTQTLNAMISASHMPMPISRAVGCRVSASTSSP